MSSDPSPPLNVRLKSPRVVSVTVMRFTPRLMYTHLMARTKKERVRLGYWGNNNWRKSAAVLKRAARSRDENTTLSETVVAEAINSLEGEREARTKPARVFPSSMLAFHFLFYLYIHNTCVALHFPPCSSFSLFLFFLHRQSSSEEFRHTSGRPDNCWEGVWFVVEVLMSQYRDKLLIYLLIISLLASSVD